MENVEALLLERKKLALEIADLERSWWKRPTYILAALPTLLAIIALSVGFLNGFFSAQLTKLDNQKHDLEAQVKEFEAKRDDLHKQYDTAKAELDKVNEQGKNTRQIAEEEMMLDHRCEEQLQALQRRLRK
jgi:outer membrane murein-binding lipoprotein Lpp